MKTRASSRFSDARNSDGGFTVLEITIATMLSALASMAIVGILISQSNAERNVSTFAQNHEEVRQALVTMQRDLRSSEPLTVVSDRLALQYRIDLKMYDDVSSTIPFQVSWRVDSVTNELIREVIDPAGNVSTTYRLRGVANATAGVPLFTYYRADNTQYDLTVSDTSPGTVAYCTVRVGIDLRAMPNGGREPVRLLSDVQLRNKLPGADECPRG